MSFYFSCFLPTEMAMNQKLEGRKLKKETWFLTAPHIEERFRFTPLYESFMKTGAKIKNLCPLAFMQIPSNKSLKIATNSGKLRYYTQFSYIPTDQIVTAMLQK